MYVVTVAQDTGYVKMEFNKFSAAIEFVETSVECGDAGTIVTIQEKEDE